MNAGKRRSGPIRISVKPTEKYAALAWVASHGLTSPERRNMINPIVPIPAAARSAGCALSEVVNGPEKNINAQKESNIGFGR